MLFPHVQQIERRSQPPGNDRDESDRIDSWLYRAHMSILCVHTAYCLYDLSLAWAQFVMTLWHLPYIVRGMRPYSLTLWQALLAMYLCYQWALHGPPIGVSALVASVQVYLSMFAFVWKRIWCGLDLKYC